MPGFLTCEVGMVIPNPKDAEGLERKDLLRDQHLIGPLSLVQRPGELSFPFQTLRLLPVC